jgi:DNA transposition AAA+ family ATPase
MSHAVFHTVYDIAELKAKRGHPKPLEGVTINGRLGVIYSPDGLNDTEHSQGCCCCGGNEITNCVDVNVNILAYALMY